MLLTKKKMQSKDKTKLNHIFKAMSKLIIAIYVSNVHLSIKYNIQLNIHYTHLQYESEQIKPCSDN